MSLSVGLKNMQQDKEFERLYRNIQRRNTHPATMARDSNSKHGGKAGRTSSAMSSSTATRSRFLPAGGPVQPLPAKGAYTSTEAGWSNVTGFRKRLDVAGSPQSDYFSSGASKLDRRSEYIGRPLTGSCFVTDDPAAECQAEQERYPDYTDSADEEDGDDATVLPSDSVSQIGRGRARSKPTGLFGEVAEGRHKPPPRQPPLQRSRTYSNAGAGSTNETQQAHGRGRRYSVVERKPRTP